MVRPGSGLAAEATVLIERELDQIAKPDRQPTAGAFWFNAACTYSLCAEMMGNLNTDGTPKADVDLTMPLKSLRADYLTKASASLEKVRELKSTRVAVIATDPDLEFWRSRQPK